MNKLILDTNQEKELSKILEDKGIKPSPLKNEIYGLPILNNCKGMTALKPIDLESQVSSTRSYSLPNDYILPDYASFYYTN